MPKLFKIIKLRGFWFLREKQIKNIYHLPYNTKTSPLVLCDIMRAGSTGLFNRKCVKQSYTNGKYISNSNLHLNSMYIRTDNK